MGVIWWGTGGTCPSHFWQWGTQYLMSSPHFLGWKKIRYFNIYLRFMIIFTGFIWTTCSHSTHIQIFWAYTVYIGWVETEIRATMIFIFQNVWAGRGGRRGMCHTPPPLNVALRLWPSKLIHQIYFYNPIVPPPPPPHTFSLQMTPTSNRLKISVINWKYQ